MSFPARNSRTDAILPSSDIYRALSHREKKNPSANLSLLDQEQSLITLGSFQPTFIATRVLWGLCSGHGYTSTHRHALSTNALLCLSCCRIRTEEGYKHLPVTAASITSLLWPRKSLITVRLNMKAEKQNVYESVLYIHALSMQLIYQAPSTVFKNTCSSASTTKKRLPCSCFFPPPKKEEFLTSLLSEPCKEQTLSPLAEEFSLCVSFLWCIQLQGLEARLAGSRDALHPAPCLLPGGNRLDARWSCTSWKISFEVCTVPQWALRPAEWSQHRSRSLKLSEFYMPNRASQLLCHGLLSWEGMCHPSCCALVWKSPSRSNRQNVILCPLIKSQQK